MSECCYINLTKNQIAIVDKEDYEQLMLFNWHASPSSSDKNKFYACSNIGKTKERKRKRISMHRFVMKFPKDMIVDHINGNSLDNRKVNLRICSQLQNTMNQAKRAGSSQFKGVKKHFLGLFNAEEEANQAYIKAAKKLRGEFYRD